MLYKAGLVLEGGGMKGVYTAGIIDYLIDENIEFETCYGVSAGACHLCSYLAHMRDRGFSVFADYWKYKEYGSWYSFFTTGNYFGVDMLYNRIPNELYRLDYDTLDRSRMKFIAVATNLKTGKAEYFTVKDLRTEMVYVRASSSVPLISRNVKVNGQYYLDGGCADPIPIKKSMEDGYEKNVVVLTKVKGLRKKKYNYGPLPRLRYITYPNFVKTFKNIHNTYNAEMDFIDKEEEEGRLFVFRPAREMDIALMEKDWHKLRAMYEMGYEDAVANGEKLKVYLKGNEIEE